MPQFTPEALSYLPKLQEQRFKEPHLGWYEDYQAVYERGEVFVGWPAEAIPRDAHLAREATAIVVGIALGDEGKGRIIDNKIAALLEIPEITLAYVSRDNGGSGSGHTIQKDEIKIALNQVPSGIFYPEVIGIMDQGMVIHPEDLMNEIKFIEDKVGDIKGKLILSEKAILATDLERAEEYLNNLRQARSKGGTRRGMAPSYAHELDRLGNHIYDLLDTDWREKLGKRYDQYQKDFRVYEIELKEVEIPDYKESKLQGKQINRKVGTKKVFLDRIAEARQWLLDRDMIKNTYLIHLENMHDPTKAFLVEKAQAVGLHPKHGTYPDIATSDTTAYGVQTGTGIWKVEQFKDRLGVMKLTYTSSVGAREMPTQIPIDKSIRKEGDLGPAATKEQKRAAWIRDEGQEYGTISQRPRDILELDLAMLTFNARMGGIEAIAATHLDLAREGEFIKVCTHYTNKKGEYVPYQAGLRYQEGIIPNYIYLPGWDGKAVRKADNFDQLPENAKKFLAYIQRRLGYPIVIVTTGPDRENYLEIPQFMPKKGTIFSIN